MATWTRDGDTYSCGACGAAGIRPGSTCACALPPKEVESRAISVVAVAPMSSDMPTLDDYERELRAVREAQRRNRARSLKVLREWAQDEQINQPCYFARNLVRAGLQAVKDQLADERKTLLALCALARDRARRDDEARDAAIAAALLRQQGEN